MTVMELRYSKGLTQEEMARALSMTISHYGNIERGNGEPGKKFMVRLKKAFPEISIDEMFFGKKAE